MSNWAASPFAAAEPTPAPQNPIPPTVRAKALEALNLANGDIRPLVISNNDGTLTSDFVLDGETLTLELTPNSVRAPGFEVWAQQADGRYLVVDPGPVKTYLGTVVQRPHSKVAALVTGDGFSARIALGNGEMVWIEPVRPRMPSAPAAAHAIYRGDDVLHDANGGCGVNEEWLAENPPEFEFNNNPDEPKMMAAEQGGIASGSSGSGSEICIAQIACDADFDFFQDYGSVEEVTERIESVINGVNVQYADEVGLTHLITKIIVRTAEPDPYTATDASALMNQLKNHWVANQAAVVRDVVQLFTGKELEGGTIGLASLGTVCSKQNGYSLVQSNFSSNFACTTDLSSHELGHNWSATHCSCPSYTMNPSATCHNVFEPSQTIPQIVNFKDDSTCLQCGAILKFGFQMTGETGGDHFAQSAAMIEDINGDAKRDMLIGAPFNDENGVDAGKVYALSGVDGSVIWSKLGEKAGNKFGWSISAWDDRVLVGAPYVKTTKGKETGRIYLLSAADGSTMYFKDGSKIGVRYGWSVSGGGDVNGDGIMDYLIGAPNYDKGTNTNIGAVYIYSGADNAKLKTLYGAKKSDRFGYSVAMLGRVGTDSKDDFIVGAPQVDDKDLTSVGRAYVYSGATFAAIATKTGTKKSEQLGKVVARAGFIDDDDRVDFAVSSPNYKSGTLANAGRVQVVSATGTLLWVKTGTSAEEFFGTSVSAAGDPNGDGRNEIAIGSPFNDLGAVDGGSVVIHSGVGGTPLFTIYGTGTGDQLGSALAGRGELNSVDRARVVIGASAGDATASDVGLGFMYWSLQTGTAATAPPAGFVPVGGSGCDADLATNGAVDVDDLLALLQNWGACAEGCPPSCEGDFSGNCAVDADDLVHLLATWGPCK